jgi:predicted nucleic-acid-binding protein
LRFAAGPGDFADFVILESAIEGGATQVLTFDKALHKHSGFVAP